MCYVYLCLIEISSHQMVSILQTVTLICDTASVFIANIRSLENNFRNSVKILESTPASFTDVSGLSFFIREDKLLNLPGSGFRIGNICIIFRQLYKIWRKVDGYPAVAGAFSELFL